MAGLTQAGVEALGLPDVDAAVVQRLYGVRYVGQLHRVGRAAANIDVETGGRVFKQPASKQN